MFGFFRKSAVQSPSAALRRAIEEDGLPPGTHAPSTLRVVESSGAYSGRKVRYVRIFDPAHAAERGVQVRAYSDLDAHPTLVLRAGHIEKDGTVVINWRAPAADTASPVRTQADRTAHGDDEGVVFGRGPDGGGAP